MSGKQEKANRKAELAAAQSQVHALSRMLWVLLRTAGGEVKIPQGVFAMMPAGAGVAIREDVNLAGERILVLAAVGDPTVPEKPAIVVPNSEEVVNHG